MSTNRTFRHVLLSFSHPVSIAAVVLLLFNDHIWRKVAPSWITGKIGDFAWLVFAPFLLAALLAWLLPKCAELAGRASIIITGLVFVLVKTVPTFHAGFAGLFKELMGWTPATLLDPTDLLALPALLIACLIWQHITASSEIQPHRGWLMLLLGVLATTANTGPQTEYGVMCLVKQDVRIAAISYLNNQANQVFFSDDGGLTWHEDTPGIAECSDPFRSYRFDGPNSTSWQVNDPANPSLLYRFTRGVAIDSSRDSGQTWQQEVNLGSEDARAHLIQRNFYSLPVGPFDAVMHSKSGNLIVAMGREGVLVRTAQGEWRWVTVGTYAVPEIHSLNQLLSLLDGEIWLAIVLLLLAMSTLILVARLLGRRQARQRLMVVLLVITWSGWCIILLGFRPAIYTRGQWDPYPDLMALAIGVVALLAGALALREIRLLWRENQRGVISTLIIAVIIMLIFLLPFVLWVQGVIPFYATASVAAPIVTIVGLITGCFYLRRLNRVATQQTTSSASGGVP